MEKTKEQWAVEAQTLKICANSSFGKFGNKYSVLYSPDLLLHTTLTGQLALLMLIERLHLAGVNTVSANTDGIIVRTEDESTFKDVCAKWEKDTGLGLERTDYNKLFNESVNSYFAITTDGEVKGKGTYAKESLSKNPSFMICPKAVIEAVNSGTSVRQTIRDCGDLSMFIALRKVTGGAMWKGQEVGKTVRWYMGVNGEHITYKKNGNNVPITEHAVICNRYPNKFPSDINYDWYINRAEEMLGRFKSA